jgi:hypothetical protein
MATKMPAVDKPNATSENRGIEHRTSLRRLDAEPAIAPLPR